MRPVAGSVLGLVLLGQSAGAPGPERVVDTGELMDLFLHPAYLELQAAVAKPPATRADWAAIYRASVRLAEMENPTPVTEGSTR